MAATFAAMTLLQYLLQVTSLMMARHLGELSLSGVTIASSFRNVTGFSLVTSYWLQMGFIGALETLCGQTYRAQQYDKVGTYIYCAIFNIHGSFYLSLDKFSLDFYGQAINSDRLILLVVYITLVTLGFHTVICWILVFKSNLGNSGAAVAISLSYWLNVILLTLYMSFTTTTAHFFITYGISVAASTRVSNELGGKNPDAARLAAFVVMVLVVVESVVASTIIFCCRYVIGFAFSNNKEVIDGVIKMAPFLCVTIIIDSYHAVLADSPQADLIAGIVRGIGWQHIGAYINVGAYYLEGIPTGVVCAFVFGLRGKGLWLGMLTGSAVEGIIFTIVAVCTKWRKHAMLARERIFEVTRAVLNILEAQSENSKMAAIII
ncbi:hypothetical protein GQ457_01G053790 [Hibiscus cannabinus]